MSAGWRFVAIGQAPSFSFLFFLLTFYSPPPAAGGPQT